MASIFGEHLSAALAVVISAVLVLFIDGLFYVTRWAPWLLSPEGEFRPHRGQWLIPVMISIGLSGAAGLAWRRVAVVLTGKTRRAASYLSILFLFMAIDDFLAIHEKIERLMMVDWLFLYAPIMLVGGLAGLYLLAWSQQIPGTSPARLFGTLGAVAWIVSQGLEAVGAFWDDAHLYAIDLIVPEEMLETVGSATFALAGWCLVSALRRDRVEGRSVLAR